MESINNLQQPNKLQLDSTNDSVRQIVERINELNQEAWQLRMRDSPRSFELSKEAIALARNIDYKKGLAHGLKSYAFCLVRLAKSNEARPCLNEALYLFELLSDLEGQAVVNGLLAILERNSGNIAASLRLSFKAIDLSNQTGFREHEGLELYFIGVTYKQLGDFEKALDYLYKSLKIFREDQLRLLQSYPINIIGSIYFENGDYSKALEYFEDGLSIRQAATDKLGEAGSLDNIGFTHLKLGNLNEAISYCTRSLAVAENTGDERSQSNALLHLAEAHKELGDITKAMELSNRSLELRKAIGDRRREVEMLLFLFDLYKSADKRKAFETLSKALEIADNAKMLDLLGRIHYLLSCLFKTEENYKLALHHLEVHTGLEKELHKNVIGQKVSTLEITHKAEETRKEAEAIRQKNEELTRLNDEIETQKQKLEIALSDLKATQAQLIQSAKMASLGELTAGIAHEIQNPLNFVNNFSEVNNELTEELERELMCGNLKEVTALAVDIRQNSQKITQHGKRADAIVKAMLQHSGTGGGQAELTDINELAEEYLILAYHGFRAREKSFVATIRKELEDGIGQINIVRQDIGRVLLNLLNNAFHAVDEKSKVSDINYEPTVNLCTQKNNGKIEISVADNGNGIPQKIQDKIFQPFFTTKPTGQGTGLGLSLAYDIVKAHGGDITVTSEEGKGSAFIITLPV